MHRKYFQGIFIGSAIILAHFGINETALGAENLEGEAVAKFHLRAHVAQVNVELDKVKSTAARNSNIKAVENLPDPFPDMMPETQFLLKFIDMDLFKNGLKYKDIPHTFLPLTNNDKGPLRNPFTYCLACGPAKSSIKPTEILNSNNAKLDKL